MSAELTIADMIAVVLPLYAMNVYLIIKITKLETHFKGCKFCQKG